VTGDFQMQDGVLLELLTLVPRTAANDAGLWPTPSAHKNTASGDLINVDGSPWDGTSKPHSARTGLPVQTALMDAVKMWPTPRANDAEKRGNFDLTNPRNGLAAKAKLFPTPCAMDYKGSGKAGTLRDRLDYAAERGATKSNTYATPQARDYRTGATGRWEDPERTRNLNDQVGGQLNPTWVEWLMGWPLGWTDLKPLEMDRFQQWLRSHGES